MKAETILYFVCLAILIAAFLMANGAEAHYQRSYTVVMENCVLVPIGEPVPLHPDSQINITWGGS